MVFSVRGFIKKKQEMLSVQEVHNLWDMLTSKNHAISLFQVYLNFTHDPILKMFLKEYLAKVKHDIETFKNIMNKYGIKSGDSPPKCVHSNGNNEIISDELIGRTVFTFAQEHVEMLLRAIRTSTTNDGVRRVFIKITYGAIKNLEGMIKLLKLKGWIDQPPIYPNVPPDIQEIISTSEAFHLWDQLTFRYDNIEQTKLYSLLAHDGDFKLILKQGLHNVLQKQAAMLEKECCYFGLSLPKGPAETMKYAADTELVDDDYLYRMILAGVQGAASLHAQSFKQSITNDRVRKIFRELLIGEISHYDKLVKFGDRKSVV